ncbi:hypothetical protein N1496_02325 [Streptococcus didelphis]|uniref:Uncharacterized protein n=1 Tax=Streptococcus didelphis TaxID=102886 RepID=A0ABY9LHY1_9STRE|nr:hypothetical protein [Streptococcus didelphis]WMB28452.1 hypothetical protein N1496_02325 [Streptococcus didelphis]
MASGIFNQEDITYLGDLVADSVQTLRYLEKYISEEDTSGAFDLCMDDLTYLTMRISNYLAYFD